MSLRRPEADELLLVARVIRPHGLLGELKLSPETDDPNRLLDLERLYIGQDAGRALEYSVDAITLQPSSRGTLLIATLAEVEGRDDADRLKGRLVFAAEADLPPLEEDEFFFHDLAGFDVCEESGVQIGVLKEYLDAPAQPLLVIEREGKPDAMVPAVDAFVLRIDTDDRKIVIRTIEGLLD